LTFDGGDADVEGSADIDVAGLKSDAAACTDGVLEAGGTFGSAGRGLGGAGAADVAVDGAAGATAAAGPKRLDSKSSTTRMVSRPILSLGASPLMRRKLRRARGAAPRDNRGDNQQ
jgi:hypothetical protein